MSQENVEVVRQMLDSFNHGDVAAVIGKFDKNCGLREPPEMPDRLALGFRGHNGIRDWMANLREVGGIEFEPISFTTSGDVVLSELTARGRGQASAVPFEWRTFAVVEVRDAKIVGVESFLSRVEALEAAGLSE